MIRRGSFAALRSTTSWQLVGHDLKGDTVLPILILLALASNSTEKLKELAEEMDRLHTNTALVLQSSAVDEHPLWSPSGDYLAVNVMGKWLKVNLLHLTLKQARWRGKQKIGVIASKSSLTKASSKEIKQWTKVSRYHPRALTTKAGTRIELRETNLGTSLIVRRRNQKPQKLWTTDLENCHSLVLSTDEQYIAFICEQNGVAIMRLTDSR